MDSQPLDLNELIRLQAEMERVLRAMQQRHTPGVRETTPRPSSYASGPPRPTRTRRAPLDRLHAHTKAKRTTRRRTRKDGSLGLDPEQAAWEAEEFAARYQVGYFGPEHGLTPAQAWEANRRLAKADRERPMHGRHAERCHRLRIGGILSSVKAGRARQRVTPTRSCPCEHPRTLAIHHKGRILTCPPWRNRMMLLGRCTSAHRGD